MKEGYRLLGDFIQPVDERNRDLKVDYLLGVSISKQFIPSIANIVGTDLSSYKIVRTGQFAYGPVTSRNGEKISIALLQDKDCIISSSYTVFEVTDNERLDPEYLMLWFSRPEFDRYTRYMSHGSVREIFDWDELCKVELPVPSIEKQRGIVKAYNTITDRIELKRKINDNLAQQLRLLYDYWFTQFDFPDESGNPYRSSGGQMVWNNGLKRKIPESWCVVPLGEVSSFRNGINYDKNTTGDTTYHIVNVRNISSSSILLDERELDEICLPCTQAEKYLVSNESILIARSGIPGAPRILYNPSKDIIFCGFIICATPIDSILQHYLMLFLKQLEGSTATQTGGSILKNVSQDTLRDLLVPIPSKDILTQFNQRVALIYEFMHNNLEETSKLQHLRDWLLPMLMNGQATISD